MKEFLISVFNLSEKTAKDYSDILTNMFQGAGMTLGIFFLTLLFAVPLALIIAFGRISKNKVFSGITGAFLSVVRGTPLMLQLLIWYFGPRFIFGSSIVWDAFAASIVAFAINYACYFAEIYRGGIQSIPKGQYDAGFVLGYTHLQTFFRIVLPQVVKRIMPAMGNEIITLVKDTSLVTIISVAELMYWAKAGANTLVSIVPFVIAGVFYYVMNWFVSLVFKFIEKKLSYYN